MERLVVSAIWSREDPLFHAHYQHRVNPPFNIYYKCGIMLVLKGWCLIDSLDCCTVTVMHHIALSLSL